VNKYKRAKGEANGNTNASAGVPFPPAEVRTEPGSPGSLTIVLDGDWRHRNGTREAKRIEGSLKGESSARTLRFATDRLGPWDTGLVLFVKRITETAGSLGAQLDMEGLPGGLRQILAIAASGRQQGAAGRTESGGGIRNSLDRFRASAISALSFVGEVSLSFVRLVTGKSRLRTPDLLLVMQDAGISAVPIVSLISLLVGLIFAFVGAIQLKLFGAQIYVADLVGIAMARAMGAVMTGIIMAGRTGASFAAQIGTMQGNEEIDALRTTGISPIDFLVLPRVLGLALMMPLLTLYADFMGFLGGLIVGVSLLGFDASQYYHETRIAVSLTNVWIGLFMGFVFGILVGLAGCLRGMECGRSAMAVGVATTSAVVTSIVSIIVATAIITVLLNILGL
jgi:phospholipid/cholesterol/gamma-HCH transport system permease protein